MAAAKKTKKKTKKKAPAKKKKAAKKRAKKAAKKSPAKPKAKAKKPVKKPVKKSAKKSKPKQAKPLPPPAIDGTLLGRVSDFFAHVGVVALTLGSTLKVGDSIHIKGHTTDLIETVMSIQIEHQAVESAGKGDAVGIKLSGQARKRDWVFRIS